MKERFMYELKGYLSQLEEDEREEILRFYEERFFTGKVYEGKTEEEIIGELERPEDIARNVLKEYGYAFKSEDNSGQTQDVNAGKILGVVVFDLFIASWLVPVMLSVTVAVIVSLVAFLGSVLFFSWSSVGAGVFMVIAIIGYAYLWGLLVLWLYDTLLSFTSWLLKWHLEVIGFADRDWPRQINKFKVSHFFKRHPRHLRFKNRLKVVGFLMILVGVGYNLFTFGTIGLSGSSSELVDYSDMEVITNTNASWYFESDMDVGNVEFHRHDSDELLVEASVIENTEMTIDIDSVNKTLTLTNEIEFPFFNFTGFIHLFRNESQTIDIYLPNDFEFESLSIEHMNGSVVLRDMTMNTLNIETMNGTIELLDVNVATPSELGTTNGDIDIKNSVMDVVDVSTTNGHIKISKLTGKSIELETTNGRISLENINDSSAFDTFLDASTTNGEITLINVYMNDVTLHTTNGSISYENDERTFILDDLDVSTTNGSEDINVLHD